MTFEVVITGQHWIREADDDHGIAQSALQQLRTLERDHEPPQDRPYLLCHRCGCPVSFGGCNFDTDGAVWQFCRDFDGRLGPDS